MVRIKKLFSLSLLIAASSLSAMEIDPNSIRADRLGKVGLYYDESGFTVIEDGAEKHVHNYDIDKLFQNRSKEEIAALATIAKFKVSKFNNGEYAIVLTAI